MRARKSITNLFQLLVLYMNKLTGQYHYTGGGQDLETETPATLYQPVQEKRERDGGSSLIMLQIQVQSHCILIIGTCTVVYMCLVCLCLLFGSLFPNMSPFTDNTIDLIIINKKL